MIKAVLFDLYGVLVDSKQGSFSSNFKKIFKPDLSVEEISRIKHDLYMKASRGEITREQFWDRFFEKVGKFEDAEKVMLDIRAVREEGIPDVLIELKKKYKIAVVSNHVDYWARYWLKKFNLLEYFDAIIISSNIGARKPDPKIYLAACEELNVKPGECIYIGDGDDDITGAKALGMKTIFIPGESEDAEADFRIKSLKEVIKILGC